MRRLRNLLPGILLLLGLGIGFAQDDAPAAYVHAATRLTFPEQIARFTRAKVTFYNQERSDVGIDYRNDPYTTLLSVYVYPAAGSMEDHFKDCCAAVVKQNKEPKLLEEKPDSLVKGGTTYEGRQALYAVKRKLGGPDEVEVLSQVRLFRYGSFWVLYRISYLKARQAECGQEIEAFLEAEPWPAPPAPQKPD